MFTELIKSKSLSVANRYVTPRSQLLQRLFKKWLVSGHLKQHWESHWNKARICCTEQLGIARFFLLIIAIERIIKCAKTEAMKKTQANNKNHATIRTHSPEIKMQLQYQTNLKSTIAVIFFPRKSELFMNSFQKLSSVTLLKVTLLYGCFHIFQIVQMVSNRVKCLK